MEEVAVLCSSLRVLRNQTLLKLPEERKRYELRLWCVWQQHLFAARSLAISAPLPSSDEW
jgi:hypothetical protein